MLYSFVDIETTGSDVKRDDITELAIVNADGNEIGDTFSVLLQPAVSIPGFIQHFTGISNEMVENAVVFPDVMEHVEAMTEGRIIVAHHAAFDLQFLKEAFRRNGKSFKRNVLCTLRLSRKILPPQKSYSLDHLVRSLQLPHAAIHRGLNDALACHDLFFHLAELDEHGIIDDAVKNHRHSLQLPPQLDEELIESLPQGPGVYFFSDEKHTIKYVGKARNIKSRVKQHFAADSSVSARSRFMKQVHDIQFELTGNELLALVTESILIKQLKPEWNVAQRKTVANYCICAYEDARGYLRLGITRQQFHSSALVTLPTLQEARAVIDRWCIEHRLCRKLSGLHRSRFECYDYAHKKCDGACAGKVSPEDYNERVRAALASIDEATLHGYLIGDGRSENECSIILFRHGHFVGYGYALKERIDSSEENLEQYIQSHEDQQEIQLIVRRYLAIASGAFIELDSEKLGFLQSASLKKPSFRSRFIGRGICISLVF